MDDDDCALHHHPDVPIHLYDKIYQLPRRANLQGADGFDGPGCRPQFQQSETYLLRNFTLADGFLQAALPKPAE